MILTLSNIHFSGSEDVHRGPVDGESSGSSLDMIMSKRPKRASDGRLDVNWPDPGGENSKIVELYLVADYRQVRKIVELYLVADYRQVSKIVELYLVADYRQVSKIVELYLVADYRQVSKIVELYLVTDYRQVSLTANTTVTCLWGIL